LQALLGSLPKVADPNLIVGYDTNDDAGVYRLTKDLAIVVTADFITPPFDDPRLFGQVAAANALSDVFAMGGRPVVCVNLVSFPSGKLGPDVLAGIISGAREKIEEAGAVLVGGHTVEDPEPKFGLAVTGVVDPNGCWTNSGARQGDALVLTKPIGSGVLLNANLKGWVSDDDLAACTEVLVTLNKLAAETAAGFEIHAATDVTGYGLAGHALEMARGANVQFELSMDDIPVLGGAAAMYDRGMTTGSTSTNRQTALPAMKFTRELPDSFEELLFDPQTNGGLLFALPDREADALIEALRDAGIQAASRIGTVVEPDESGPSLTIT
jgi:selenide,water dikinase